MTTHALPVNLTEAQIEEFGREIDAIRDEVMDSRGERDRNYIVGLIRFHRRLALGSRIVILASLAFHPDWGHALAGWPMLLSVMALGTLMLGLAKIIENMELAHNILHAQWDWMKDPAIQSNTWEWDIVCPSDQWMHTHNVVHHTWTNVIGKDRDIGYGILRVTEQQRWHPAYLLQPFYYILLMLLFEWGIATGNLNFKKIFGTKEQRATQRPLLRAFRRKAGRQMLKDYVLWPLLAGPYFFYVLGANAAANVLRSIWTNIIIFCGHFPAGVHHFSKAQVENETRARWYLRQLLGSCNIGGGKLFHILSGNLSHQIEHHLFPDTCSNRYPEIAPRVRALAARYGLPYNTGSLTRQFGTTLGKILRLSLPGPNVRLVTG